MPGLVAERPLEVGLDILFGMKQRNYLHLDIVRGALGLVIYYQQGVGGNKMVEGGVLMQVA